MFIWNISHFFILFHNAEIIELPSTVRGLARGRRLFRST